MDGGPYGCASSKRNARTYSRKDLLKSRQWRRGYAATPRSPDSSHVGGLVDDRVANGCRLMESVGISCVQLWPVMVSIGIEIMINEET